jgi:hypothetical protein
MVLNSDEAEQVTHSTGRKHTDPHPQNSSVAVLVRLSAFERQLNLLCSSALDVGNTQAPSSLVRSLLVLKPDRQTPPNPIPLLPFFFLLPSAVRPSLVTQIAVHCLASFAL